MGEVEKQNRDRAVALVFLLALAWWAFGLSGTLRLGAIGARTEDRQITRVRPGSAAEVAGLRLGDRVSSIRGNSGVIGVGRRLVYTIERDGEIREVELTATSAGGKQHAVMIATVWMGLAHLVCGLLGWWIAPGRPGALFALFCATTAVHWSGFRPTESEAVAWAFFCVLLVGTAFAASFLLHFAVEFPRPLALASRSSTRFVLYAPPLAALVVAAVSVALHGGPAFAALQGAFFLLTNVPGYLFSVLALVTIVFRMVRGDSRGRVLTVMLVGMLAAYTPYLLASLIEVVAPSVSIPGGLGAYPYTLFFVLTPVTFLYALYASVGLRTDSVL